MSLTLEIPSPLEHRLAERAASVGKTVEVAALEVLENWVEKLRPLEEIMAPFAEDVAASGMTEAEFDAFFEVIREEVWQDQQRKTT